LKPTAAELLEHLPSNFELILMALIFELQSRFIYGLQKELSEVLLRWGIFFLIEELLNIAVTSLSSFYKP